MSKLIQAYSRSFERQPYLTLLITNGVLMSVGDVSAQTLAHFGSIEEVAPAYDLVRTMRFGVFGASMGPLAGAWNKFLEVKFPLRPQGSASSIPMQKVKVETPPSSPINPIPGMKLPAGARLERGGGSVSNELNAQEKRRKSTVAGAGAGLGGKEKDEVSVAALVKRVAADQLGMAPISLFIFLFSMALLEGLDWEETVQKIKSNYIPIILVNWQVWPLLQLLNFRYIPLKYRVPFGSICGIAWTCFLSVKTNATAAPLKEMAA